MRQLIGILLGLLTGAGIVGFVILGLQILGGGFECHRGTCSSLGQAMVERPGLFWALAVGLGLLAGGFVTVVIGSRTHRSKASATSPPSTR